MFHPQDLQTSIQVLKYFLSAFAARITLQVKPETSHDSQESPPSWRQEAAALPMAHDPAPKAQKAPARRRVQQGAWRVAGMLGLGPWGPHAAAGGRPVLVQTVTHRNAARRDNAIKYEQNGTCFLATKLLALWDFMLNGMKKKSNLLWSALV